MKKANDNSSTNFVINMALFTVFAMALTLALITGASTFREISKENNERFEQRTPLLYVANKLSGVEIVQIVEIGGDNSKINALKFNDDGLDIYIYLYNGYIHEMYDLGFDEVLRLDAGIALFAVRSMTFEKTTDNLLCVIINDKYVYMNLEVIL